MWADVKAIHGTDRVVLGPSASYQWTHDPKHLLFVLARYKHAARLIGRPRSILELGCGEGIGARILAGDAATWRGVDTDTDALDVARELLPEPRFSAEMADVDPYEADGPYGAVVSLDVIEHLHSAYAFLAGAAGALDAGGICVIGTPNATAEAYQSEASRIGHVNLHTHDQLRAQMALHFRTVQMFGMNDEVLHTGFLPFAHYLLAVGIR